MRPALEAHPAAELVLKAGKVWPLLSAEERAAFYRLSPSQRAMAAALWWKRDRLARQFRRLPAMECVYFLRSVTTDLVKVGWTANLHRRVGSLQTASAEPLRLVGVVPGGRSLERHFHRILKEHRVRGEWFQPSFLMDGLLGEFAVVP